MGLKFLCILLMLMMLTGCGSQPVYETVQDPWIEVAAPCREITLKLPTEAAAPVLQSPEEGKLYLCDGYVLTVQTFGGGDLDETLRQLTGFNKEQLTYMQTQSGDLKRYACVWSAAGEGGDHVGRAVILDDGSYHYAVSVMADFATAGDLADTWQELLSTVKVTDID